MPGGSTGGSTGGGAAPFTCISMASVACSGPLRGDANKTEISTFYEFIKVTRADEYIIDDMDGQDFATIEINYI